MVIVYSTFASRREAEKISQELVQNRLAACVNIFTTTSVYRWRTKVKQQREYAVFIKTKRANFLRVKDYIVKNHSYEVPAVIEFPVGKVNKDYLQWLRKEIKKSPE